MPSVSGARLPWSRREESFISGGLAGLIRERARSLPPVPFSPSPASANWHKFPATHGPHRLGR